MDRAPAPKLLAQARALPAAQPLLAALGDEPVYLVGGAVRDLLCGGSPFDLDLAVEGLVEPLLARLRGARVAHDRFATATVAHGGVRYDLAATRAESYPRPGALPDVRPASIAEDLERRDFTVNAIALGLAGPLAGELLSVDGALSDLAARRLAVLHERSFIDDPTRLLRMVRYQARLGFEIAPGSRAHARATLAAGGLATLSAARIGNELRLLAAEADPVGAFSALHELGADAAIDPQLCFDTARAEIARTALAALPREGRRDLLVLAVALLDAPRDHLSDLLNSWELQAADRDAVIEAATRARATGERMRSARTGAEIAHAVGSAAGETTALVSAVVPSDPMQRWLRDLRHRTLQITGADLIAAGIPEGPAIGRGLAAARDAMLDDLASDRETQLRVALRHGSGPPGL